MGAYDAPLRYVVVTPVRNDEENLRSLADRARDPDREAGALDHRRQRLDGRDARRRRELGGSLRLGRGARHGPPERADARRRQSSGPSTRRRTLDVRHRHRRQARRRHHVRCRTTSSAPRRIRNTTRLGIASGIGYERGGDGVWRQRHGTGAGVWGANRAYRWACLQILLPLEERMGWDTIDLSRRQSGWDAGSSTTSRSATIAPKACATAAERGRGRARAARPTTWAIASPICSRARPTERSAIRLPWLCYPGIRRWLRREPQCADATLRASSVVPRVGGTCRGEFERHAGRVPRSDAAPRRADAPPRTGAKREAVRTGGMRGASRLTRFARDATALTSFVAACHHRGRFACDCALGHRSRWKSRPAAAQPTRGRERQGRFGGLGAPRAERSAARN